VTASFIDAVSPYAVTRQSASFGGSPHAIIGQTSLLASGSSQPSKTSSNMSLPNIQTSHMTNVGQAGKGQLAGGSGSRSRASVSSAAPSYRTVLSP